MPTQDYVPNSDLAFCDLLNHVATTIPQYYGTLGIGAATPQIVILFADNAAFKYLCARQGTLRTASEGATRERNRIRYGDAANPNTAADLSYPAAPALIPSPILPGVERRFRAFVAWLRSLVAYEDAIGEALHIVGAASTLPDTASLQPELSLILDGGKVHIRWTWGPAAGVAKALYMEVDRGSGPALLAVDTNPNYTDTAALPAAVAKWRYRAIWMRDGEMFGQWSPWVDINVGG